MTYSFTFCSQRTQVRQWMANGKSVYSTTAPFAPRASKTNTRWTCTSGLIQVYRIAKRPVSNILRTGKIYRIDLLHWCLYWPVRLFRCRWKAILVLAVRQKFPAKGPSGQTLSDAFGPKEYAVHQSVEASATSAGQPVATQSYAQCIASRPSEWPEHHEIDPSLRTLLAFIGRTTGRDFRHETSTDGSSKEMAKGLLCFLTSRLNCGFLLPNLFSISHRFALFIDFPSITRSRLLFFGLLLLLCSLEITAVELIVVELYVESFLCCNQKTRPRMRDNTHKCYVFVLLNTDGIPVFYGH